MGAALRFDVDKEMTSFYGRAHRDHAEQFVTMLAERLLTPRFDPADVERTRRAMLDDLRSRLRNNDDENLGKEVLSLMIYPPDSRWHHYVGGTVRGLESITIEDLRKQAAKVLRSDLVTIGLAGGATEDLSRRSPLGGRRARDERDPRRGGRGHKAVGERRATGVGAGSTIASGSASCTHDREVASRSASLFAANSIRSANSEPPPFSEREPGRCPSRSP
jgi:hypothetical protein